MLFYSEHILLFPAAVFKCPSEDNTKIVLLRYIMNGSNLLFYKTDVEYLLDS